MSDFREVIAGSLPLLKELLWEWVAIQERYFRLWKGKDALWWYNERASMGGFAGAVWRAGGVVLEEYTAEKLRGKVAGRVARESTVGRGDMDFLLARHHYVVEAKQCWPRLGIPTPMHYVDLSLVAAKADVRRADPGPDSIPLAVVFASPRSLPGAKPPVRELKAWIDAARCFRKENACAVAWAFPEEGRKLQWAQNGRYYPGAVVFIKRVGRKP